MNTVSLTATAIFNMSFGEVFVVGTLEGQTDLVRPGEWELFINGHEAGELEAVGEQLPKGAPAGQRIVSYKGSIDTTSLDLSKDQVVLWKVD